MFKTQEAAAAVENGKMKAVVLHAPGEYKIEQVDIPVPGKNEVLVKIKSVAICGSDPGIFNGMALPDGWPPHYPFIAGHEFAGEIAALGEDVVSLKIGDRVAGEAHCGCGICEMCRNGYYNLCDNYEKFGHHHYGHASEGCYAQYQKYDVKALTLLPENVSYDEGSMVDTGGVGFNAIRLCGIVPGSWTVIIGPGPMGIILMQIAKSMGSKVILIGYHDEIRLSLAKKLGADYTIESADLEDIVAAVNNITGGKGAAQSYDCAGVGDTLGKAILMTSKRGKVGVVAYPKQAASEKALHYMVKNQIMVQGVRANPNCSKPLLDMISEGTIDVKSLVTHIFKLEDIESALDVFINHKDGAVKVVLHPND